MGTMLNEEERRELDRRVAETEKRTGAQIVLAVVERSDVYPEVPWRAFALGAAVTGLAVIALDILHPRWPTSLAVLLAVTTTLGVGAACALASILLPRFARLFLDVQRVEGETRQYAESLFLSREVFATRQRRGVLLFVSIFERKVVVLPDRGLVPHLPPGVLQGMLEAMTAACAEGQVRRALEAGLDRLEEALTATAATRAAENELSDGIVEEHGQ